MELGVDRRIGAKAVPLALDNVSSLKRRLERKWQF
jgi:hypothetical protein